MTALSSDVPPARIVVKLLRDSPTIRILAAHAFDAIGDDEAVALLVKHAGMSPEQAAEAIKP